MKTSTKCIGLILASILILTGCKTTPEAPAVSVQTQIQDHKSQEQYYQREIDLLAIQENKINPRPASVLHKGVILARSEQYYREVKIERAATWINRTGPVETRSSYNDIHILEKSPTGYIVYRQQQGQMTSNHFHITSSQPLEIGSNMVVALHKPAKIKILRMTAEPAMLKTFEVNYDLMQRNKKLNTDFMNEYQALMKSNKADTARLTKRNQKNINHLRKLMTDLRIKQSKHSNAIFFLNSQR
jgi:hypothetical protein